MAAWIALGISVVNLYLYLRRESKSDRRLFEEKRSKASLTAMSIASLLDRYRYNTHEMLIRLSASPQDANADVTSDVTANLTFQQIMDIDKLKETNNLIYNMIISSEKIEPAVIERTHGLMRQLEKRIEGYCDQQATFDLPSETSVRSHIGSPDL